MNNKPADPNLTIELKNERLEQCLAAHKASKSIEDLSKLVTVLMGSRLLVPGRMLEGNKQPVPQLLKGQDNMMFFPVFTSLEHLKKGPKAQAIINMPYMQVNTIALKSPDPIEGVVINPFTDNLVLKKDLLKKIADTKGQVTIPEDKIPIVERLKFEKVFLPRKLYQEGEAFFRKLADGKAASVDQLYEESYANKRMYPYLEEDFSVMTLAVSQDLTVVRIEFPEKDMMPGLSYSAFLCWNEKLKKADYYLLEKGKEAKSKTLTQITAEGKVVSYGEAPVEGAELQRVLDLVNPESGLTS